MTRDPAIPPTARPRLAYETEWLAQVAADLLAQRGAQYPALVEQGKLSAEASAAGLRIAGAVAADWQHRWTLAPRAAEPNATKAEKIETLEGAVHRTQLRVGKAGAKLSKFARRYEGDPAEMDYLARNGWFGKAAQPLVHAYYQASLYADACEALLWWERNPLDHLWIAATNLALGVRPRARQSAEAA